MRGKANIYVAGRTPLMLAAFAGDIEAMQDLLYEGADANAQDGDGDTALMFAAFKGYAAAVLLLLRCGANVNAQAKNGWTALKAAKSGSHDDITDILRQAGAVG